MLQRRTAKPLMRAFRIRFSLATVAFFLAISYAATLSAQARLCTSSLTTSKPTLPASRLLALQRLAPACFNPTSGGDYSGTVSDGGVLKGIGEEPLARPIMSSLWIFFCCRKRPATQSPSIHRQYAEHVLRHSWQVRPQHRSRLAIRR